MRENRICAAHHRLSVWEKPICTQNDCPTARGNARRAPFGSQTGRRNGRGGLFGGGAGWRNGKGGAFGSETGWGNGKGGAFGGDPVDRRGILPL